MFLLWLRGQEEPHGREVHLSLVRPEIARWRQRATEPAVETFSAGSRVREAGESGCPSHSGPGVPAPERGAVGQPTGATGNVPWSEGGEGVFRALRPRDDLKSHGYYVRERGVCNWSIVPRAWSTNRWYW